MTIIHTYDKPLQVLLVFYSIVKQLPLLKKLMFDSFDDTATLWIAGTRQRTINNVR